MLVRGRTETKAACGPSESEASGAHGEREEKAARTGPGQEHGGAPLGSVLDLGLESQTNRSILVLGDGDFSYSRALATSLKPRNMISTSYDDAEELRSKYPHAADVINDMMKIAPDSKVKHGVDARKLEDVFSGEMFHRVVFMFPQHPPKAGSRNKIQKHRELLEKFLASASKLLDSEEGRLYVTLLQGQGGTSVENAPRGYNNSWMLNEYAARAGLLIADVHRLDADRLYGSGYTSRGYMNDRRHFLNDDDYSSQTVKKSKKKRRRKEGWVHVLIKPRHCQNHAEEKLQRREAIDPPKYSFDNSFWVKRGFDENQFKDSLLNNPDLRSSLQGISHFDTHIDPVSGKEARTYRFELLNKYAPLHKMSASVLNQKIRSLIEQDFAVGDMR